MWLSQRRVAVLSGRTLDAAACDELGLPLLDVHGPFLRARDQELYKPGDPVHLTPRGHALLAELVLDFAEREGLLAD